MHIVSECKKHSKKAEKLEKSEKTWENVENDIVLCTVTEDTEMVQEKKEVSPTIQKNSTCSHISCMFTKHAWSGNSGASCHITNIDTVMHDITNIGESVQGSSGEMKATKNGRLHVNVRQIDGSEILHTLWPVKYFERESANYFSLNS